MPAEFRIGGTRAASILGVGFQSPFEVWAEMTQKVEREDISNLEHIESGIFLEDAAARWFEKRTGLRVGPSPGLVQDRELPWLAGTPDRLVLDNAGGTAGVLECKSTGGHARALWSDGEDGAVPLGYQVQVQTYMRLVGVEVGYCAAIVAGQKLRTPSMRRDDSFIAAMLEELQRFLSEHVLADIPPATSGADLAVLKRLWPRESGRRIVASHGAPETVALADLIACKREIKALEARKEAAEAIVKAAMQDAVELITPSARATWKFQVAKHEARPATTVESRVLRTKE